MAKAVKKEVDWSAVEGAMRKSFYGQASEEELRVCRKAYKANRLKYAQLSRQVRVQEYQAERKRWSGS